VLSGLQPLSPEEEAMTDPTPEQVIATVISPEFVAKEAIAALTAAGYSIVRLPTAGRVAMLIAGESGCCIADAGYAADAVLALLRGGES
jgi:uncharacterized membrane protein